MVAYLIVQIRFTSDRALLARYRDAVGPIAAEFGGRYLVAGGAKVEVLEGSHNGRSLVMFEFPSIEAIRDFWDSPGYAEAKRLRDGLAELDVWMVPGLAPGLSGRTEVKPG
jgi:uncharacterized protein (DUF1330 family)